MLTIKSKNKVKKTITHFRPRIRSRHPSHDILREELPLMKFRSVIRLGSTTELDNVPVQLNSVEAIRVSSNKLLMKQAFTRDGVKTANWWRYAQASHTSHQFFKNSSDAMDDIVELPYPIVAKHIYGSRGTGNTLLNTQQELEQWMQGKTLSNYIFEAYMAYNKEYRLHVTEEGCFYTCRKMLKEDAKERWFRNDSNSVWILESNEAFDKPVNWDLIVADCVKALKAVGLDFGAMDVRVQSRLDKDEKVRKNPEWIVLESNSAPSMGVITTERYLAELPKLLMKKHKEVELSKLK